jgi:Neuraminidase (sialidase)
MRLHESRSKRWRWFWVLGVSVALGCNEGSDSGSSDPSLLESDVLVARSSDDGATWTEPSALNAAAVEILGSEANPQLATDALGTWLAVWRSTKLGDLPRTDSDLLVARSTDAGATWTGHAELNTNASTDEGGDDQVQLVTDGAGVWIAVWQSWDSLGDTIGTDGDVLFARSTDDGVTWTDPAPLDSTAATDTEDDNHPQLTTDGAGNWVAVWYTAEGYNRPLIPEYPPDSDKQPLPDRDIMTSRSTDNGLTWSPAVALNTNAADDPGGDSNPQVVTDGTNWIATWEIRDVNASAVYPNALGVDGDVLCARSTDAGLTWTDPAPVNTNAAQKAIPGTPRYNPQADRFPQLATDGAGTWVAVWMSEDDLGSFVTPVRSLIDRDADILFARSTNNGATWSDPLWLNSNAPSDAFTDIDTHPQIATDGTTWIVTWVSINTLGGTIGADRDILMARSTDGGLTWTDPAPVNANAASDVGDDDAQQVSTDGLGNWTAIWHATLWP